MSKKRTFDTKEIQDTASQVGLVPTTLEDYADTNFRYLKATGLVQTKGRGISFCHEKRFLIDKLLCDTYTPDDALNSLQTLCSGATLPMDKKNEAMAILLNLTTQLQEKGFSYDLACKNLDTPADIAVARHEAEEHIGQLNELEYARTQAACGEEICHFMDLLTHKKKSMLLDDGRILKIPKSEAPAYFEWIIWRTFLAINSLTNKPWEARRFKIDQDFLPVGTAPGNGPDMVFEFDDMVLIVEVTLTSSSRQEAAEGEPVRRHVAKYAEKHTVTDKQVFGLFLAVNIDTNTANTFRLGEWYIQDDRRIDLHIIPMSLDDFKNILIAAKRDVAMVLPILRDFLRDCRMHSNMAAPEWKQKVSELAQGVANRLEHSVAPATP